MAYGRAVISSGVGGLADAVEDGADGIVVAPGDTRELRAAIERLLVDGPLRARLGAAAREKAMDRFAPEVATSAIVEVYRRAAA